MTHEPWLTAAECAECRFVLEYKYPNDPENPVQHLQAQKDALAELAIFIHGDIELALIQMGGQKDRILQTRAALRAQREARK